MKKSDAILMIFLIISLFIFIASRLGASNFLVVLSGSMEPTINMGDLVVTTPITSNAIKVGDIVAFNDGKEFPITHRVINITDGGLITKGDANEDPDPMIRSGSSAVGKIIFWVPFAGYLVYFARGIYGLLILIVVPGFILIISEIKNIFGYFNEDKIKKRKIEKSNRLLRSLIIIISFSLLASEAIVFSNGITGAYFSDVEAGKGFFEAWVQETPPTTVNKWWSDTNFIPMSNPMYNNIFYIVTKKTGEIKSTNPGGFFININVSNVLATNSLTITDTISGEILPAGDFVEWPPGLKVLLDEIEVTSKFTYTFDGKTLSFSLKSGESILGGKLYAWFHVKYALIGTIANPSNYPRPYTNIVSVTIDGNTYSSSPATITGHLKNEESEKIMIEETNTTNETSFSNILYGGSSNYGNSGTSNNVDITPPQYSNISINGTQADTWVSHDVFWTDDELSGFIFSFDNCLGEFTNDSWIPFNEGWSNVTKLINSTTDCIIRWKVYANDSSNNWNETEEFNYITTAPLDLIPPTWSENSTNSTLAGSTVEHSVLWNDNALSGYIFSFDNCEGLMINDTWVPFDGNWSNITKTVNSTVNCTINWMIYANDTSNNWNVTDLLSYNTTEIVEENTTSENITYYNYSDTTNNKIRYSYNESLEEYPFASLDTEYGEEANSSQYSATLAYEGGLCDYNNCFDYTFTNNSNKTVWHSFVLKINENVSDVKSINISWAGYSESNLTDSRFRVITNSGYEDISSITNENQIYIFNITSNFDNYLSSGYLRFQVWALTDSLSDSIRLWTDFVSVTVTT